MGQSQAPLIICNSSAELPAAVDGLVGWGGNETQHYGRVAGAWIPFGYASDIVTGPFMSAGISTHGNTGGTTGFVSNRMLFVGSNNITLSQSVNAGSATISIIGGAGGAGDGYNIIAAGTQTAGTASTVLFQNSNGISFGMSNSSVVTAQHNGLTSQSNQQVTLFATSNTTQSSTGTSNVSSLVFAGAGIVSVGITNGSVVVSGSQSNQAASAGNGSFAFQTLHFGDLNGISFSTSAGGTVVASHNALTQQSNQQITLYATSNTTQSSTGTTNASSMIFAGAGVASVGITNGSVVISVPSGGGAFSAGMSTHGNTSGATGFAQSQLLLVGGANVTLSGSFNLGSGTITISAPAPGGGAGATLSAYPFMPYGMATSTNYTGASGNTGGSTQITRSFYVAPMPLPAALSFSRVNIVKSFNTVAGTGSQSLMDNVGIYTLNGGTALSLLSSFMFRHEISQSSVTARSHRFYWGTDSTSNSSSSAGNISTAYTGIRNIPVYLTTGSFSAGMYWVAYGQWNRSSGAAVYPGSIAQYISESQTTQGAFLGSTSLTCPYPFMGLVSSTTNTNALTAPFMPGSMHTSVITHTGGTSQWKWPYIHFRA